MVTNNTYAWLMLSDGIEYQALNLESFNPFAKLNVFKIDLKDYQLNIGLYDKHQKDLLNLKSFAKEKQSPLVINGGFFTPQTKPLGLRLDKGKIHNKVKAISWWAIFYIQNKKPYIVPYQTFRHKRNIELAIQAGPRLLVNGQIPKLKAGLAQRTALAITKDKKLLIITSQNAALSTTELATLLKEKLNCQDALNLDGGSSTKLFAKFPDFELHTPSFSQVSDVLYLTKR